jgi:hypothetical protein
MRYLLIFILLFTTSVNYAQSVSRTEQNLPYVKVVDRGGRQFVQYIGLPRLDSSGWGTSGFHADLFIRNTPDSILMRWNPVTQLDEPVMGGGGTPFDSAYVHYRIDSVAGLIVEIYDSLDKFVRKTTAIQINGVAKPLNTDTISFTVSTGAPSFGVQTFTGAGYTYVVSNAPITGSARAYVNGVEVDCTSTGTSVVLDPPFAIDSGDRIKIYYQY